MNTVEKNIEVNEEVQRPKLKRGIIIAIALLMISLITVSIIIPAQREKRQQEEALELIKQINLEELEAPAYVKLESFKFIEEKGGIKNFYVQDLLELSVVIQNDYDILHEEEDMVAEMMDKLDKQDKVIISAEDMLSNLREVPGAATVILNANKKRLSENIATTNKAIEDLEERFEILDELTEKTIVLLKVIGYND